MMQFCDPRTDFLSHSHAHDGFLYYMGIPAQMIIFEYAYSHCSEKKAASMCLNILPSSYHSI